MSLDAQQIREFTLTKGAENTLESGVFSALILRRPCATDLTLRYTICRSFVCR